MTDAGQPVCANCGARLTGEYCADCGQHSADVRVSVGTLARDFVSEHVGIDAKVPRTFWRLIRHPGALTTDYLAGRRARHVLPLKLYLSASVVFFLVLALRGPGALSLGEATFTASDSAQVDSMRQGLNATRAAGDTALAGNDNDTVSTARDPSLEDQLRGRVEQRTKGKSTEEIASFVMSGFRRYLPNMIFAMLPIFALIFYLLYFRSGRFYAEHLIFAFHFHAFVFVALTVTAFLPSAVQQAVILVIFAYLFIAMRQVYRESRTRTAAKFAAATATYVVALVLASFVVIAGVFVIG